MNEPNQSAPGAPRLIDPALRGKMLPGIAAVTMYLSLFTLATIFFALSRQSATSGFERYGILILYSIFAVGLFGQLRMKRWGWAIVCAGCILLSATYFCAFRMAHQLPSLIQGFFMLVFFLYLIRPEVRDRMI